MRFAKVFTALQAELAGDLGERSPFVPFKELKKALKRGDVDEEAFMERLVEGVKAVDARFASESSRFLKQTRKGALGNRGGGERLLAALCAAPPTRAAPGHARHARSLRLYARTNAAAVRKIVKKFGKQAGGPEGASRVLAALRHSGAASFSHSPLLVDLWALAAAEDRATDPTAAPETDLAVLESPELASELRRALGDEEGLERATCEEELYSELTCCICMDVVHDACALGCGHMYCKLCAHKLAGLPPFAELSEAPSTARCAQCRQEDVFAGARRLAFVDKLTRSFVSRKEWKDRCKSARREALEDRLQGIPT